MFGMEPASVSNEALAAASIIAMLVAASAVLLALAAVRRSRRRLDRDVLDRMRRYQELLAEADQRISRLERRAQTDEPADRPAKRRRLEDITRLARQGVDPVEIARRTGTDIGEVELALNLHHPAGATSGESKATG